MQLENSYVWFLNNPFSKDSRYELCIAQIISSCEVTIMLWIVSLYHEIICCFVKTCKQKTWTTFLEPTSNSFWLIHTLFYLKSPLDNIFAYCSLKFIHICKDHSQLAYNFLGNRIMYKFFDYLTSFFLVNLHFLVNLLF